MGSSYTLRKVGVKSWYTGVHDCINNEDGGEQADTEFYLLSRVMSLFPLCSGGRMQEANWRRV